MKLNKKLLKIFQCKPITTPIRALYKTYNTLLITDLHKFHLLLFLISLFTILNCYLKYLSIINSSLLTMKFISIDLILEISLTSIYISQLFLQDLDQWVTKPLYCGMNCLWLQKVHNLQPSNVILEIYFVTLLKLYMCLFQSRICNTVVYLNSI